MGALAANKAEVLRSVVEAAPDAVLGSLEVALTADGHASLAEVRALIEAESRDRHVRNLVLGPLGPMCVDAFPDGRLAFPIRVMADVWRGLKAMDPQRAESAARAARAFAGGEGPPDPLDRLCALAAEQIRSGELEAFARAAQACEDAAEGGARKLADCLGLVGVTRGALAKLSDWISRATDDRTAAVRLAYRDACRVSEDAGPRFFDILAAHLYEPWLILRVISAAMDRPSERYIAGSDMAYFAESAMDEIDRRLGLVKGFDTGGGAAAGRTAGDVVLSIASIIAEIEGAFILDRAGPWGKRLAAQKLALAAAVESRLKEIEPAALRALPVETVRLGGRLFKARAKVSEPPCPVTNNRAVALLTFAEQARPAASRAGYGAVRTKVVEKLQARLDDYVEELLDLLRHGEAEPERVGDFLKVAADLYDLAKDEKAGQVVRRRCAAALSNARL
jgi:hypothetical protein